MRRAHSREIKFIAEIGKNFINNIENISTKICLNNAKALVDAAVESGANAVKFQTHSVSDEIFMGVSYSSPHAHDFDRLKWVDLNTSLTPLEEFWIPLKEYCSTIGVEFMTTPMSRGAAEKVSGLISTWKVGSGDALDYLMLRYLLRSRLPIIISTGMISLRELDSLVEYILPQTADLTLMHCVSKYPANSSELALDTITQFRLRYPMIDIGFSDHSIDDHKPVIEAISRGAVVVEKHFTFSRDHYGPDHKVSLTPSEYKEMVERGREVAPTPYDYNENAPPLSRELLGASTELRKFFNKCLVVREGVIRGNLITEENLSALRPMWIGQVHSESVDNVIHRSPIKDLEAGTPIRWEDLN